jgi:hypothetical protein
MLELDRITATIRSVNLRAEKHGPEEVPACDLKIESDQPNSVLSFFGSQLLDSLYWRNEAPADFAQGELDEIEPVSDKPNLRNPRLVGPLGIDYEGAGYTIRIEWGIDDSTEITIYDARINAITVDPKEGGSVALKLRAQFEVDEKLAGRLGVMIGREVTVSIEPPAANDERLAA